VVTLDHDIHVFKGLDTEICSECGREAIVCPKCHLCTVCCFEASQR
jgi:hypothetical protein